MKQQRVWCIVCFLMTLFTPGWAQNKDGLKIGFINIKSIFQDYQKVKQLKEKIRQETEAEYAKIKELKEQAKQLQEEIPLYRPGSKIRKRKEEELTEKLFEIKYKEERANHFFNEKLKAGIEQIYQEIAKEVEDYAKANNFFMVLRVADADFFGAQTTEALQLQIHTRDVLYWAKEYDITHIVLGRMNEKYKIPSAPEEPSKPKKKENP
jgi:Skp family chaperone for outer membrane proteins